MNYTDTELLNWLEKQDGHALINDDLGRWAVAGDGFQEVPSKEPTTLVTTFVVDADQWKHTIREAIIAAIQESEEKE